MVVGGFLEAPEFVGLGAEGCEYQQHVREALANKAYSKVNDNKGTIAIHSPHPLYNFVPGIHDFYCTMSISQVSLPDARSRSPPQQAAKFGQAAIIPNTTDRQIHQTPHY